MTLPEVVAPSPGDPRDQSQALQGEAPGMLGSHPQMLRSLPSEWTAQNPRPPTASQPLTILHLDTLITWLLPELSAPGAERPDVLPLGAFFGGWYFPGKPLRFGPVDGTLTFPFLPRPNAHAHRCALLKAGAAVDTVCSPVMRQVPGGPSSPLPLTPQHHHHCASVAPDPCGNSSSWWRGWFPLPGSPRQLRWDLQWQGTGVMGLENQVFVQTQSIHLSNAETASNGPRPFRQGAEWTNPSPSDLRLPGCAGCRVRGPLCSPAEVHLTLSSPTGWPHRDHVPSPWRGSSVSPLTPEFGPCPAAPPTSSAFVL